MKNKLTMKTLMKKIEDQYGTVLKSINVSIPIKTIDNVYALEGGLPVEYFMAIAPFPYQRFTEERAKKLANVEKLGNLKSSHVVVHLGVLTEKDSVEADWVSSEDGEVGKSYPAGTIFVLDANTRSYSWKIGSPNAAPENVVVLVHEYPTLKEMDELAYVHFDNSTAAKDSKDNLYSACKKANFYRHSNYLQKGAWNGVLKRTMANVNPDLFGDDVVRETYKKEKGVRTTKDIRLADMTRGILRYQKELAALDYLDINSDSILWARISIISLVTVLCNHPDIVESIHENFDEKNGGVIGVRSGNKNFNDLIDRMNNVDYPMVKLRVRGEAPKPIITHIAQELDRGHTDEACYLPYGPKDKVAMDHGAAFFVYWMERAIRHGCNHKQTDGPNAPIVSGQYKHLDNWFSDHLREVRKKVAVGHGGKVVDIVDYIKDTA